MLSCASIGKNWGSSVKDANIRVKFERYEYVADYNNFYKGLLSSPEAILGIQREFELVRDSGWGGSKTNWQQFKPEGTKFKKVNEAMINPGRSRPFDFSINPPTGEEIGVVYTRSQGSGWSEEIYLLDENHLSVKPSIYSSQRNLFSPYIRLKKVVFALDSCDSSLVSKTCSL